MMEMTPQAKKLWERIPASIRVKLLNNVYCNQCRETRSIGEASAIVKRAI